MENTTIEKKRIRAAIYIDPDVLRWLQHQRVETGKAVGRIIEDLTFQARSQDHSTRKVSKS